VECRTLPTCTTHRPPVARRYTTQFVSRSSRAFSKGFPNSEWSARSASSVTGRLKHSGLTQTDWGLILKFLCFSFAPEHTKTFLHFITIQSIILSIYSPIYSHDLCWGTPWIELCICNSLLVPKESCKMDFGYMSIIKVKQFLQDSFQTASLWRLRFYVPLKCQNYLSNDTASHSIWLESWEYFFTPNLNFTSCYTNAVTLFPIPNPQKLVTSVNSVP